MSEKKMLKIQKMEKEINEILNEWCYTPICDMIKDIGPLITLYSQESSEAIILKEMPPEDSTNITLIRTVYLLSKFAERHAGKLASLKCKYPAIGERIEKYQEELKEIYKNDG